MYLTATTKHAISEALATVQRTVRNAETEIEEAAQAELARMRTELDAVKRERDDALKAAHTAEIAAHSAEVAVRHVTERSVSRHETELSKANATIESLRRDVLHWQEQAKNWQEHYTRVEQERCGLSTELVNLTRSALTESPPKPKAETPPAVLGPPSPSDSGSPQASRSNPRTPALSAKAKGKQTEHHTASTKPRPAKTAAVSNASASTSTKPATTQAPRQIFIRRVQAVHHVKEEEEDGHVYAKQQQQYEEDEEEDELDAVRVVKRRRSGLYVADEDDYRSGSEEAEHDQRQDEYEEDSGEDELMMNPSRNQEVYGGYSLPSPQSRQKRAGNVPQRGDASPTKRRRISTGQGQPKAPMKRK